MKPLPEQVILVTGATDGIGRGAAAELARRGARVLLHGRDASRLAATRDALAGETGGEPLETFTADFADLADVRRLADEVGSRHAQLDGLVNNAGIGRGPSGRQVREVSRDGFELRFQVNYLAPGARGVTGEYFDVMRTARANAQAYDTDARRRLRQLSERWTGAPRV